MNDRLKEKLKSLPRGPGVYFHKDKSGEIIYVGKAASLKNRVRQYFQSSRNFDAKTVALVREIFNTDWVEVETELDALFLESEMIKRYKPKFNILLMDDKSYTYVRINMQDKVPDVSLTRHPLDDGAKYFGPYYGGAPIKKALRYLRRVFPYYDKPYKVGQKMSLEDHLGLAPGIEAGRMTEAEYKNNLRQLVRYIEGDRVKILRELEREMRRLAKEKRFEEAAVVRNQYLNLRALQTRVIFGDKEFMEISKDYALAELKTLLGLKEAPARIEGFDISHLSGKNVVASMVVFKNGASSRADYRKFKMSERNDDTGNLQEAISRRLKHIKDWGKPDLILVDGGMPQVNAVRSLLEGMDIAFAGRNKSGDHGRNANFELIGSGGAVRLAKDSPASKLITRIDEEAHRFAVSYHSSLRSKAQVGSALDEITGIGEKTKALLKRKVGSVAKIREMSETELAKIVGKSRAGILKKSL